MRTSINLWIFIILCLLGGWVLGSCTRPIGRGTFSGYRTLKDGTKLVLVSDQYCPLSQVIITPSIELGDQIRVKDWNLCSEMIDDFEQESAP